MLEFPNEQEFLKGLDSFDKETEKELRAFMRKVALELHARLVARTPTKTGFTRAAWNISINEPDRRLPRKLKATGALLAQDPVRRANYSRAALANFNPFNDIIWINNSAPNILELEAGRSAQAPQGIMLVTLAELSAAIEAELI